MADFIKLAYSPEDGLKDQARFRTNPSSEEEARAQFQDMFDQVTSYINGTLLPQLSSANTGLSGAERIGSAAIANLSSGGVSPVTVRDQIALLKTQLDKLASGHVSVSDVIESLDGEKIIDGTIGTEKLVDGAITASKFADGVINAAILTDGSIETSKLADGAVVTANITSGAVTEEKIGENAVTNTKIMDGEVITAKLKNQSVSDEKLAVNAVSTDKIKDLNVTEEKLASNAVTTAKITNGSITTSKIADSSVTTAKLSDYSVTKTKTNGLFAWKLMYASSKLGNNGGTLEIPSMEGYSELLIIVRDGTNNTNYVRGEIVLPLENDGLPIPNYIFLAIEDSDRSTKPRWLDFINTLTISFGGSGGANADEYLYLYAR